MAARSFSTREILGLAKRDQLLFPRDDFRRRQRNLSGDAGRNGLDAVQIAVEQIAGLNFQPANFDRRAKFHDVNVGVRDGNAPGKKLKAQFFRRRKIAHRAIGHRARRSRARAEC